MTLRCKTVAHFLGMTALELKPMVQRRHSHVITDRARWGSDESKGQVVLVPIGKLDSWKAVIDKRLVFAGPLM